MRILCEYDGIAGLVFQRIRGRIFIRKLKNGVFSSGELEIVKMNSPSDNDTVVLVDDATGDLDVKAKFSFLSKIAMAGQIFHAFTELPDDGFFRKSQIFQVENGTVS